MHAREGEVIVKIIKRHPTPYVIKLAKVVLISIPVYVFLYLFAREFGSDVLIGTLSVFTFLLVIGFFVALLDYILDKLVVTNLRVILIDWKSLLSKTEEEVELHEIQDIKTSEFGILGKLRIFKYGTLEVESSASRTSIVYRYCNDPGSVKHLMFSQLKKHKNHLLE